MTDSPSVARQSDSLRRHATDQITPTRGLLGERRGRDPEQYADRLGRVRVWHFGNGVGVLESMGVLNHGHAEFIVSYFGRHVDRLSSPRLGFCNWLALTAYSNDVRQILTRWQLAQAYEELHVAQTSKLLAMSVSLTNAVLRREIQTYRTLEEVHRIFEARMRRLG